MKEVSEIVYASPKSKIETPLGRECWDKFRLKVLGGETIPLIGTIHNRAREATK